MKLKYTKISPNKIKFFYEKGELYGEFYINFKDLTKSSGEAKLLRKSEDYAYALLDGLFEELNPTLTEMLAPIEKALKGECECDKCKKKERTLIDSLIEESVEEDIERDIPTSKAGFEIRYYGPWEDED